MKAILVLAHGSREKDTEKTLEFIMKGVKEKIGVELITEAYLQFSEKSLNKGIEELVTKGAKDITILPYFLFEGVHIKEDIPGEIEALKHVYPDVVIQFGRTLGTDPRLVDILVDRIQEVI